MTRDELQLLVPKHKSDFSSIHKLESLFYSEIKPIIPDLLYWLQDMHWEVAHKVRPVLEKHIDRLTYEVLPILESNDTEWMANILLMYCDSPFAKINKPILAILSRLAQNPTDLEQECNLDGLSFAILINNRLSKIGVYARLKLGEWSLILLKKNGDEHSQFSINAIQQIRLEPYQPTFGRKILYWFWILLEFNRFGYDYEVSDNGLNYNLMKELVIYLSDGSVIRKEIYDYNSVQVKEALTDLNSYF